MIGGKPMTKKIFIVLLLLTVSAVAGWQTAVIIVAGKTYWEARVIFNILLAVPYVFGLLLLGVLWRLSVVIKRPGVKSVRMMSIERFK